MLLHISPPPQRSFVQLGLGALWLLLGHDDHNHDCCHQFLRTLILPPDETRIGGGKVRLRQLLLFYVLSIVVSLQVYTDELSSVIWRSSGTVIFTLGVVS